MCSEGCEGGTSDMLQAISAMENESRDFYVASRFDLDEQLHGRHYKKHVCVYQTHIMARCVLVYHKCAAQYYLKRFGCVFFLEHSADERARAAKTKYE